METANGVLYWFKGICLGPSNKGTGRKCMSTANHRREHRRSEREINISGIRNILHKHDGPAGWHKSVNGTVKS
jgi:hypothetical protein